MFKKIVNILFLIRLISAIRFQQNGLIDYIEKKVVRIALTDCTKIKYFLGSSYDQASNTAYKNLPNVILKLYTNTGKIESNLGGASKRIINSQYFDTSLPTIMIAHGYGGNSEFPNIVRVATALKALGSRNVITLDHSAMTGTQYYLSSTMVQYVGEALAPILAEMHTRGVSNFHLIGHSIGAHIFGFAGKKYKKLTGINIDRITGLDPAGPCFFNEPSTKRLTSSDADFVDTIHTDILTFGIDKPIGDVDFYPNSGDNMPGCVIAMCSHTRAFEYFIESINNDNFFARSCGSYSKFTNRKCTSNPIVNMGYWLPTSTTSGLYYLNTASSSNYALGNKGVL